MRNSELCGLIVSDVDLNGQVIHVTQQLHRDGKHRI